MGIDIYMSWKGMTAEEKEAQVTGFSVCHGHVGYLREAYHGGPYATKVLLPECFGLDTDERVEQVGDPNPPCDYLYPSEVLRERLPAAIEAAKERALKVYKDPEPHAVKSFKDFVELAEEKEKETGEPVTIYASY